MRKLQTESKTVQFLGDGFVAFPRSVFNLLFLSDKKEQLAGILYTALLSKVFFSKGHVKVGNRLLACNPGEYISSHQNLATYCGMKLRTYHNALKWLIDAGLVRTAPLLGGTHFSLPGYDHFNKRMKLTGPVSVAPSSLSLEEAERRMGGRSMQFDNQKGQQSGKGQK